jgi:hypothetical protein
LCQNCRDTPKSDIRDGYENKFYSNSKLALKSISKNLLSLKVHFSNKEEIFDSNKVLGMVWDANTDLITYNAKYKNADQFIEAMSLKKSPKEIGLRN